MPKRTQSPASPKTGSKASARAPLVLGAVSARAGRTTRLELPVARLPTGTWLSLPVAVVHGARPGPTIWINSGLHGDELNGIPIIRRVLHRLDPTQLAAA